ncbi:MAG: FAD-binding oxidoreductase [Alphaproteobacteria bacterium]|nr:FAD-binding oxidoreductase [Alphaproteobacteria bacterium]MCW5742698.1 FAD-binding oxidoreductase [Alphaproteobacteria bacterium]
MSGSCDVAIVGGGAVGSSIAYWLTRDRGWKGRVVVIERDPAYARASSALSASSIRQQFSTPLNIALSRFGIGFLRDVNAHLGVEGEPPVELGLREPGYLFLATPAGVPVLRDNHAIQCAEGCDVALLEPDEVVARYPWMDLDGIALASLGTANEGWFDGPALMQAFRRKARSQGTVYLHDEVVGMELAGSRVTSLRLRSGESIAAGVVVNAGGPWSASVAAMAGASLPVEARRRCVFVFDCRERFEGAPLTIDASGIWFRPEGRYWLAGAPPLPQNDVHELPLEVDHSEWDELIWSPLAARVPAFESVKVVSAWAGYYEYNTFDHNGIVGPHPTISNLIFATGFSGHGIQQSPATGRAVAELIAHGRFVSLDLTPFGFERIAANRPIVEHNII